MSSVLWHFGLSILPFKNWASEIANIHIVCCARLAVLSTGQILAHIILIKPCELSAIKETEAQGGVSKESRRPSSHRQKVPEPCGHVGSRAPDSKSSHMSNSLIQTCRGR